MTVDFNAWWKKNNNFEHMCFEMAICDLEKSIGNAADVNQLSRNSRASLAAYNQPF